MRKLISSVLFLFLCLGPSVVLGAQPLVNNYSPHFTTFTIDNKAQTLSNLGLGSIATQPANAVNITGGAVSGVNVTGGTVTGTDGTNMHVTVGGFQMNLGPALAGMLPLTGGTLTGTLRTNAIQSNVAGGVTYDGTSDPVIGGTLYMLNSIIGDTAQSSTDYTAGLTLNACIINVRGNAVNQCQYIEMNNYDASGGYIQASTVAVTQQVAGARQFGMSAYGVSLAGATSGETHAAYIGAWSESDPTTDNFTGGLELQSIGDTTTQSAIEINNGFVKNGPNLGGHTAGYLVGIKLDNGQSGGNAVDYAYISDGDGVHAVTAQGTIQYGISYKKINFTTLEYDGAFALGPTAANYNSRIEVTGSATGAPTIAVVGAGTTPAANGDINLVPLGPNGTIRVAGTPGVKCPAGTVSLMTLTVVDGIITHC